MDSGSGGGKISGLLNLNFSSNNSVFLVDFLIESLLTGGGGGRLRFFFGITGLVEIASESTSL